MSEGGKKQSKPRKKKAQEKDGDAVKDKRKKTPKKKNVDKKQPKGKKGARSQSQPPAKPAKAKECPAVKESASTPFELPDAFNVTNDTKNRDFALRSKLEGMETRLKRLVSKSIKRSASDSRKPTDSWNDRFWVTVSKSNDVISTGQREFFGSSQKDIEWAHRGIWRGLEAGGTEANFANVKATRDQLMRDMRGFNAMHFLDLNKRLSMARRFFKLLRWLKHFDDIPDAMNDPHPGMRRLLCADIACNFVADIAEDITSLDKVGFIPKGILPQRTEYYANWCQMMLAVTEIIVAHVKERRLAAKTRDGESEKKVAQKHSLQKLEVCKYWCDLVKAFYDCELSFATEISFIFSGLLAAFFSTHKQMVKCLA